MIKQKNMKMKKRRRCGYGLYKSIYSWRYNMCITQVLMEKTKLMPGRIMVILVTSGIVLGACGTYEPLV